MGNHILGLDIGSSKICAVVGSVDRDGVVRIESVSERPSEGIRAGIVENIETALKVVSSVIEDVELKTGRELQHIVTSIGGQHISGLNSQGVVGISDQHQEIRKEDIYKSMEVARAFELPLDREILHTLVQEFRVDGRGGIKDPVDMLGHRLETKVMIVTGSVSVSQNINKCISRAGFQVQRLILQQLADSEAVLSQEEKEMGTLLINIGGGMTNMIGYIGGAPYYVGGINMGGNQVSSDLAYILNKPKSLVEELKCEHGCCYGPLIGQHEDIIIPQVGGWPSIKMPKREICRIIEPRMVEIFSILKGILAKNKTAGSFGGGVVITGGGSMLPGTVELAAEVFGLPARLGLPKPVEGLESRYIDPQYATAIGLVLYESKRKGDLSHVRTHRSRNIGAIDKINPLVKKVKDLFDMLF
ncbi:MAG: cell division protein FtsA [Spirochaetales bacterium]|nr:cell division protein FtsA [Spirochaetales bacterium]